MAVKHYPEWYWTESKFQTNFSNWMRNHGIEAYKTHGGQFGTKFGSYSAKSGWSDLIIKVPADTENNTGATFYVELKRHGAHLRQDQIDFFNKNILDGFEDCSYIFYAHQWPEFKRAYKETGSFRKALTWSATKYYAGLDWNIASNVKKREEELNADEKHKSVREKRLENDKMYKRLMED